MTVKCLRRLVTFITCLIFFLFLPAWFPGKATVQAVVVINEIFPKPVPDENGEWVELYNTGPDAISLGNWRLENTSGTKKPYTMSASAQIPVRGIITLYLTQTGLILNNEGDGVNLYDPENNLIDSQSYAGTLGFNNSVGRSTDGSGTWTVCREYSESHLNENYCPAPTATPIPTSTLVPTPLPTLTLKPTIPISSSPEPTKQVVGLTTTPTNNGQYNSRLLGIAALFTGIGLGFVALIGWLVNRQRQRI